MSGPNAQLSLPPGDRDDAPLPVAPSATQDAGRDQAQAAGGGLLPGLTLEIERLDGTLSELQMALGDFRLGRAQIDWALMESTARRAAVLARHIERTVTTVRHRRTPAQQAAE